MNQRNLIAQSRRLTLMVAALAIFGGAPQAIAQATAPAADKKHSSMKGMGAGGDDMHGSMMGMMKGMESMRMSGDTDRDFAMMMKMHHQGAIDMAQMELKKGKDAKMRAMAKAIIEAQQKEIKEFDRWLAAHK
jgi:uncharacterized protein (DUF305 family)